MLCVSEGRVCFLCLGSEVPVPVRGDREIYSVSLDEGTHPKNMEHVSLGIFTSPACIGSLGTEGSQFSWSQVPTEQNFLSEFP